VGPEQLEALQRAAAGQGAPLTVVGRVEAGEGIEAGFHGAPLAIRRGGWRHD
jgi:thiamine monophosphate kinase